MACMVRPSAIRADETEDEAACRERRAFAQDLKPHLFVSSTKRHAEPDFRGPLHDCEGHHRIMPSVANTNASAASPPYSAMLTLSGARRSPTIITGELRVSATMTSATTPRLLTIMSFSLRPRCTFM